MPFETESARSLAAGQWKMLSAEIHHAINLLAGAKVNVQQFRTMLDSSDDFSDADKALVNAKILALRDDVLEILGVSI